MHSELAQAASVHSSVAVSSHRSDWLVVFKRMVGADRFMIGRAPLMTKLARFMIELVRFMIGRCS
jgi:hypothetical protein